MATHFVTDVQDRMAVCGQVAGVKTTTNAEAVTCYGCGRIVDSWFSGETMAEAEAEAEAMEMAVWESEANAQAVGFGLRTWE